MNVQIVAPSDRIIISGQAGVPSASGTARTSEACVRRGAAYEALAVAIAAIATVRDRSAARVTVGMQCTRKYASKRIKGLTVVSCLIHCQSVDLLNVRARHCVPKRTLIPLQRFCFT